MNKIYFFLFLVIGFSLNGQNICSGNLGENIFTIGDFGSGSAAIIQMDPEIAPGYIYSTNPPPNDGYYTITNNMNAPQWSGLWASWLRIQDNSDDPEGYMMVVNASYEPGIFYEETVEGLCENTLYEFSSDVINLINIGVTGHHEPNLSFLLDDVVQYSSGIVPQDAQWHKYGFTFTTGPDQTTVKLTLSNNAPGGIGNDLALDNISFRACGPSAFANAPEDLVVCSNELDPLEIIAETINDAAIQWQLFDSITGFWTDIIGENDVITYHSDFNPGAYNYRYLTAGNAANLQNEKCRVISDVATVTVLPIEFTVYDTICENLPYLFNDEPILEEGFYEATFVASSGCDSFVDLFLTHVPEPELLFDHLLLDPLCFGDNTGAIEISNISGGNGPYEILLNEVDVENRIEGLGSGIYNIVVQDKFLCQSAREVSLEDPEEFRLSLGNDTTVNFGTIFNFDIASNYDIASGGWQGNELECMTCVQNSAQPFESGRYIFEGVNELGCQAVDSILLQVNELGDLFYKPNIFSPNDDGFNDVFQILSSSQAIREVNFFKVYDRLGNIVYSTQNRMFQSEEYGWDGRINGSPASVGTYTYLYLLTLINDAELTVSGDVTLIR
ncbi:hypothetical protein GCM10007940_32700 [Portibacter lacus]|uniref:Gliding motility-associated C-terminal domain-containing protein n=1 Tax=Portibacter lacus TaxID=1099794 RepID=A0AA37SS74_9BACT|nr:hypothetical protein GCM10007940_32700 [Portibacter lacus]